MSYPPRHQIQTQNLLWKHKSPHHYFLFSFWWTQQQQQQGAGRSEMASSYEWLNDLQGGKYSFSNPHSLHLQDKEFRLGQEKNLMQK